MKLKLDENLSRHLASPLSRLGHDVETAADEGMLGATDVEIAEAAKNEGRMILTLDVGFADMRKYPPGSHPGIMLFRLPKVGPISVNQFIEAFTSKHDLADLAGCVVVVEQDRVRIRRP